MPASLFSVILGLAGLGQSWRIATALWNTPSFVSNGIIFLAALIWLCLLIRYVTHASLKLATTLEEFLHPIAGGTPALLGISTMLICQAALPWSTPVAWSLLIIGIGWHLLFSVWHTGVLWQGARQPVDTAPTLYLPTVAGNFTAASALGAFGYPTWAWLFLGAGLFSWLALESLIIRRLWHDGQLQIAHRALLGIQFAPPVVCAAAILVIEPMARPEWMLMLLGYGFYQMLVGIRLKSWINAQPFGHSWWAFSFGVVSATVTCLKLALSGVPAALTLAFPVFILANIFISYLCVCSLILAYRDQASLSSTHR